MGWPITFLAAIPVPLAVGHAIHAALGGRFGRRSLDETLVTAWLLGHAWIGVALTALATAGLPVTAATAWPTALAPLLLFLFAPRSREAGRPVSPDLEPGSPRGLRRLVLIAIWLLVAFYLARAILHDSTTALQQHDAIGIWAPKAMAVFHHGGLDPEFFTLDRSAPMHPDYPLLVPMHGAWLLLNHGVADERVLKVPAFLFWLSTIVLLHRFIRPRTGPVLAAAFAAAFGFIHFVYQHALFATADLAFGVFAFRGVMGLVRRVEDEDLVEWRLSLLFVACAMATKNEGVAVVAAGVGLAGLAVPGRAVAPRLKAAAALALTALVLNLPWLLFRWRYGLHNDLLHGEFHLGFSPDTGPPIGPLRVPYLVGRVLELAFVDPGGVWNYFWFAAALGLIGAAIRIRTGPSSIRMLLGFLTVMATAYLSALCISPHDIDWHSQTALPRLILHLAIPVAALMGVVAGDFLERTRSGTMAGDRQ
jgi:hypothetical protein